MAIPVSLHSLGSIRNFFKGEVLYGQGSAAEEGYFLLSGTVGLFAGLLHPVQLDQLEADDFVGFALFTDAGTHRHTAIALTDGQMLAFSKGIMSTLPTLDSSFFPTLMRSVSHSLNRLVREHSVGVPVWKGHRSEEITTEETVTCPLCHTGFKDISLRAELLTPICVGHDLRVLYEEADPLWYGLTVCPACHYTRLRSAFPELDSQEAETLQQSGFAVSAGFTGFSENRSLSEVVSAYELALRCHEIIGGNEIQGLRILMSLYWLYDDTVDTMRQLQAARVALELFNRLAEKHFDFLPDSDRIRCDIQRAELFRTVGEIDDARKLYLDIITQGENEVLLTQIARDALGRL